jgi:ribosome maturation factor RimP
MDKSSIVDRVRIAAEKAAETGGIEIVNVELAGTKAEAVLRIYIDKEGGVTLEDCGQVSREVEAILDEEDFIPTRYVLEVSSPGIERPLFSKADFVRFTGQLAKIRTREAVGEQRTFVGVITEIDGDTITVDDRTSGPVSFDYANVEKANLKIDLSKEFGRK